MLTLFNLPPTYIALGKSKANKARLFFLDFMDEYSGGCIVLGITAKKKTKLIADTLKDVTYYGNSGSLWEAYNALEKIDITPEMAPFLTDEVKQFLKNKIVAFISTL